MKATTYTTTDKQDAVKTVRAVIQLKNVIDISLDIVNGETGEVLFSFRRGNVEYIDGEFARLLIK